MSPTVSSVLGLKWGAIMGQWLSVVHPMLCLGRGQQTTLSFNAEQARWARSSLCSLFTQYHI
eukprot:scaffold2702_cov168-Amphora_coffeaeformis.AAC.3